jgi:tRNA(Ile)-lysidine synthase
VRVETEFERALLESLKGPGQIACGTRIVVAVSGGADSCALLAGLVALGERHDFPLCLAVAHVDHGLRGAASQRDAEFVAQRAASLGLPCFTARVQLGNARANLEERARDGRLAALRGIAGAWRASAIALGHTRDDQAETFLMRLARGGGVASLGGMGFRRADGLLRPLLGQSRAAGREYLRARDLVWVEDESNYSTDFFRNRVRHELLPVLDAVLGVDAGARLARLADELRVESELAACEVARRLRGSAATGGMRPIAEMPGARLPLAALQGAGEAAGRLLHAWMAESGVRPTRRQVEQALGLVREDRPSGEVALPGGWRLRRRYSALHLLAPEETTRLAQLAEGWPGVVLSVPGAEYLPNGVTLFAEIARSRSGGREENRQSATGGCGGSAGTTELYFSRARFSGALVARPPQRGDRIELRGGHRKLSDLLIDLRVPRDLRCGLTVVECGSEILWVPGVATNRHAAVSGDGEIVVLTCDSRRDLLGERRE